MRDQGETESAQVRLPQYGRGERKCDEDREVPDGQSRFAWHNVLPHTRPRRLSLHHPAEPHSSKLVSMRWLAGRALELAACSLDRAPENRTCMSFGPCSGFVTWLSNVENDKGRYHA
jgi:hypothetical protein